MVESGQFPSLTLTCFSNCKQSIWAKAKKQEVPSLIPLPMCIEVCTMGACVVYRETWIGHTQSPAKNCVGWEINHTFIQIIIVSSNEKYEEKSSTTRV